MSHSKSNYTTELLLLGTIFLIGISVAIVMYFRKKSSNSSSNKSNVTLDMGSFSDTNNTFGPDDSGQTKAISPDDTPGCCPKENTVSDGTNKACCPGGSTGYGGVICCPPDSPGRVTHDNKFICCSNDNWCDKLQICCDKSKYNCTGISSK